MIRLLPNSHPLTVVMMSSSIKTLSTTTSSGIILRSLKSSGRCTALTNTRSMRCHLLQPQPQQLSNIVVRSLSSTSSSKTTTTTNNNNNNNNNTNRRFNNNNDQSSSTQQQQSHDNEIGLTTTITNSRSNNNVIQRNPFVLTNMKTNSNNNNVNVNNNNSNYRPAKPSASTTPSAVLAAQLPRVLSRFMILKYRHAPLLLHHSKTSVTSYNNTNPGSSSMNLPNIPQLSSLFTNYNHGGGIGGTGGTGSSSISRLFSSTSMDDIVDGETTSTTAKSDDSKTSSQVKVSFYAVYGKRDFMEIQQLNFIERPISSKEYNEILKQEQEGNEDDEEEEVKEEEETEKDGDVHEDQDNEENDEVTFAEEADLYSLSEIHKVAEDQFGTSHNLQYYHTGINEWRNLQNDHDLDQFQTFYFECIHVLQPSKTPMVVPIRIPDYYADKDDEEEEEMADPMGGESSNVHTLEAMIEHLMGQLIEKKWSCEEHHQPRQNDDPTTAASSNDDDDNNNNNVQPTPIIHPNKYRLMKEVIHDSKTGIIDESLSDETTTATTTASSDVTSSDNTEATAITAASSSVDDSNNTTVSTTAPNTTNDNDNNNVLDDDRTVGRLVNETTTIMPDDAQPTVTKTYMYMNTKDFVLSCAAKDAALRGLLFYYPNSLDHIVECLHYKFLWDNYYLKDMEDDGRNDDTREDGKN